MIAIVEAKWNGEQYVCEEKGWALVSGGGWEKDGKLVDTVDFYFTTIVLVGGNRDGDIVPWCDCR